MTTVSGWGGERSTACADRRLRMWQQPHPMSRKISKSSRQLLSLCLWRQRQWVSMASAPTPLRIQTRSVLSPVTAKEPSQMPLRPRTGAVLSTTFSPHQKKSHAPASHIQPLRRGTREYEPGQPQWRAGADCIHQSGWFVAAGRQPAPPPADLLTSHLISTLRILFSQILEHPPPFQI